MRLKLLPACTLILILFNIVSFAQTVLKLTPVYKHVVHPASTTVQVKVENISNLHSASITVQYDNSLLDFSSLTNGSILTGLVFTRNTPSTVTVDLTNLDLSQFSGTGILFNIQFDSKTNGVSPITFTEIKLRNNSNQSISVDTLCSAIKVSGPPEIVYINKNYSEINSDTHEWGYDAFTEINEGIASVIDSGTVVINADSYNYSMNINKDVILKTMGTGTVTIDTTIVLNSSLLTVKNDIIIGKYIACNSGNINSDSATITLNSAASVLESDGNYIIGNLKITQSIGTEAAIFGNIGVSINDGTTSAGNITITRVSGRTGKTSIGSVESISRKWIVATDTIPVTGRILTFSWVTDDANGIGEQGRIFRSSNNGISWSSSGAIVAITDNSLSSIPLTQLNYVWTIADGVNNLQNATGFVVDTKIYLEGTFNGTSMNTNLSTYHFLPRVQPYSSAPFNYNGTENVSDAFLSTHLDIVDWVLIEIRQNQEASSIISRRAGFLLSNGKIVDINGVNPVEFKGIVEGNYYLVIRHRNHLSIMSAVKVGFALDSRLYDFSTGQDKAFGSGFIPMKQLSANVFGLIAGDANSDGTTDAADINLFWRPNNGTTYNYNKLSDFNLDATIDALDINMYWRNNNGKSTLVP